MININLISAIKIFIITYILGQVLEIGGLYFSAKYADKSKVNLSKTFFIISFIGEYIIKLVDIIFWIVIGMLIAAILF